MARGGARPGAGRKRKPGGGTDMAEVRAKAVASGETPLDYMLRIMRDPSAEDRRRDTMAQAAAPYINPRLQSTVVKGDAESPLVVKVVKFAGGDATS